MIMKRTINYCVVLMSMVCINQCQVISPTFSSSSVTVPVITVSSSISTAPTPTPVVTTQNPPTITPCDASPCKNGGTCTNLPNLIDYSCACDVAWTGTNCENNAIGFSLTTQLNSINVGTFEITGNAPTNIQDLLTDTTSQLFKDACAIASEEVITALQQDGTLVTETVVCIRFFFASLHFDYILKLSSNSSNVTTNDVQQAMSNGINITAQTNTLRNTSFIPLTVVVTDTNECNLTPAPCDNATSTCVNLAGSFRCECSGNLILVDSSKCQQPSTDNNDKNVIIVTSVVAGSFVLLVILVIILLTVRKIRNSESYRPPNVEDVSSVAEEPDIADIESRRRATVKVLQSLKLDSDPNTEVAPAAEITQDTKAAGPSKPKNDDVYDQIEVFY